MKNQAGRIFLSPGRLHGSEIYLLIVLFIFGTLAIFLLPINGGYDEEEHLIRVWEMADLTFLPNEKLGNQLPFPKIYRELSYRRDYIVRAVPSDFWDRYGDLSIGSMEYIYDANTRSVYSPPLLLPQALTMRYLGMRQQLPALSVFYACRLAGLFSYILLCFLAIRLIPYGKWILALLACSPLAILQSATISPDTISNGIAFLFIGGCLAVEARKEIHRREFTTLALLIFVLFWGKVNIVFLVFLPFLIITPSQFKIRYGYLLLLAVTLILFAIEVAGWNLFAYSRYHDALRGADPSAQVKFILSNPFRFAKILLNDVWINGLLYLRGWTALYGLDYWPVPSSVYYLYGAGLLGLVFHDEKEKSSSPSLPAGLVITFIIASLWTITSLYLSYTPAGSGLVLGVQGRYFTGVMPLLFLALACLPLLKPFRIPSYLPVILGGSSAAIYIIGMYLSYHVVCGSQYYTGGLCYQPNYKNWAPDEVYSAPVSESLSIRQEAVAECDGMTEFLVWMDASKANVNTITEITLMDAGTKDEIAHASVAKSELPIKNWYILSFPPVWNSAGNMYVINITAKGGDGPQVAYSLRQEYVEGKLYENLDTVDRDAIFKMGCVAGWDK